MCIRVQKKPPAPPGASGPANKKGGLPCANVGGHGSNVTPATYAQPMRCCDVRHVASYTATAALPVCCCDLRHVASYTAASALPIRCWLRAETLFRPYIGQPPQSKGSSEPLPLGEAGRGPFFLTAAGRRRLHRCPHPPWARASRCSSEPP